MQDKSMISKIVYIVLVAVLALAAVFGYDVGVIQPREVARDVLIDPEAQSSRAAGVNVRQEKALLVENYITDQGTLTVGGATTLSGGTTLAGTQVIGDGTGTVAIDSSDWDISTTGAMTGIGAVTTNGLATLALGATVSGATTSINADSNFATNINTGSSNAALTLGGGSGTVAINSSDWDITTGGDVSGIGTLTADGAIVLGSTLDVTGATTITGVLAANGGLAIDSVFTVADATGQVALLATADTDAANYDNLFSIEHDLVGLGTKDRVYGINIEMTRPAGYGTTNGDHDDAGLKIRMNNKAVDNTAGTVMRGVDVNVKNDNPSGAITTLSGATFTAQTDTGSPPAGNVSTAYAVQGQITANAPITDSLIVADFRNFRQTATEPTIEYGVQIRNGNTTGTGIDRGLSFQSEAATVGAFGYVIDMNDAEATTADLRLSQGETISNLVDGQVAISGDLVVANIKPSVSGSAAANNYCMSSDCDTGMWYPGDNIIGIAAGGSERARVTTSGLEVTGAIAASGALTGAAGATLGGGDLTLSPAPANGNGALKNEISGLPRIAFAGLGAGTNAALSVIYLDDSPTGECAPVDGSNTEAEGSVDGVFRYGASSYRSIFAVDAAADDGFLCTVSSTDFETVENLGVWVYPTVSIASGDLQFVTTDTPGGAQKFSAGAMTANTWNWVEVDISALAAGTGNAVTGLGLTLTAQGEGALGAFSLYVDRFQKWLTADSDTLAIAVLQDGVLSVVNTTAGVTLVEDTDYFARYISGSDAIVYMTNQSAALSVVALVAY